MNTIYRRSESNWIAPKAGDKSATYWRSQARELFARIPSLEIVEIVKSGNKTDSMVLARGCKHSPIGTAVIVASTGGKWGKSRRDYTPAA